HLQNLVGMIAQKSVGRIEKYNVRAGRVGRIRPTRGKIEPAEQITADDSRAVQRLDCGDILAQPRQRRAIDLKKCRELRSATKALQSHAAGPRKAIINQRALDLRRQDIEQ